MAHLIYSTSPPTCPWQITIGGYHPTDCTRTELHLARMLRRCRWPHAGPSDSEDPGDRSGVAAIEPDDRSLLSEKYI